MKYKYDRTIKDRLQEREEDVENLISAAEVMAIETNKNVSKNDETRKLYNQAWEQQKKMRDIEKIVGKFNV
jgi:hypothetical protein